MAITRTRYSTVAIVFHWLIAAAVVFQIVLGWRMGGESDASTYAVFQLHKSIGITILILSLARLGWRLISPPPPPLPDQPGWEKAVSKIVHIAFHCLMIGLPLTGWILVSASKIPVPTKLFGVVPWPHLPGLPGLEAGTKATWEAFGEVSHTSLVYLTYLLLALHVGAVVKHQCLDRDSVFSRMAVGARPGLKEFRLWLVAGGLVVCLLAGFLFASTPRNQSSAPGPAAMSVADSPEAEGAAEAEVTAAVDASGKPAAESETSPVSPETQSLARWNVRADNAQLRFVTQWSGASVQGRFRDWEADILFSPDDLAGSRIRITIDTGSAETGDDQRDSTLPGAEFFDTSNHPNAVFEASRIRRTGEGRYVADGALTLRGQRRPVSLPFRLDIQNDTARASGSVRLDRTLFGVGQGMYASTDAIPAMVQVSFSFTAVRAPSR